jgi:hypothetical protein
MNFGLGRLFDVVSRESLNRKAGDQNERKIKGDQKEASANTDHETMSGSLSVPPSKAQIEAAIKVP